VQLNEWQKIWTCIAELQSLTFGSASADGQHPRITGRFAGRGSQASSEWTQLPCKNLRPLLPAPSLTAVLYLPQAPATSAAAPSTSQPSTSTSKPQDGNNGIFTAWPGTAAKLKPQPAPAAAPKRRVQKETFESVSRVHCEGDHGPYLCVAAMTCVAAMSDMQYHVLGKASPRIRLPLP
jgi:hypothetical protein